jgi:hypothetical protein
MDVEISKHAKDLIQKYASGLFKDSTLEVYGIKTAKIKEFINVELPVVEVAGSSMDFIFLLEDNSYLHFEFQTSYNKKDLIRFAGYDIRLYERDEREITTVIIYTANVKHAPDSVQIGSMAYTPQKVMMNEYNGDAIYMDLNEKIVTGNKLTDNDILMLIFLPLMKHTFEIGELAVKSIKLAQRIPDIIKRNACIAAAFALSNKYLDDDGMDKVEEALMMTDLVTRVVTKSFNEGEENKAISIAKKLLIRGISATAVMEDTGLSETTIRELQAELVEVL